MFNASLIIAAFHTTRTEFEYDKEVAAARNEGELIDMQAPGEERPIVASSGTMPKGSKYSPPLNSRMVC